MERLVEIDYVFADVVPLCHEELRKHFEPLILATQALPEVHVLASLTLRIVRLARATSLLCKDGLTEESRMPMRSATESIINLLYIMYVGPKAEGISYSDLARRFNAYGDIEYWKMLDARPKRARDAFKKHKGMSDAEFDTFLAEKKRLSEEAKSLFRCTPKRWHSLNLVSMARKVRDDAPDFVNHDMADTAFSTFVSANSATHGGALSLRSEYKAHGNAPLELVFDDNHIYADVVANEAIWAWKTVAQYYGKAEVVKKCLNKHMKAAMKQRYENAPPAID